MEYKIGDRKGCIEIIANPFKRGRTIICPVKCDCGNVFEMQKSNFTHRKGDFCVKCKAAFKKTHGMSGTKIYYVWHDMKSRCEKKTHKHFRHYGGRGISVSSEWSSFDSFIKWALANGYKEGLTIDRIDNNGNYEPSNCRWTTWSVQINNRSNTIYYEAFGERMPCIYFVKKYGINRTTLAYRIGTGLTVEEALSLPSTKKRIYGKCLKKRLLVLRGN